MGAIRNDIYLEKGMVIPSLLNTISIPNNTVRTSKEIPSDKVHKNGHCLLLSKWIVSFSGCLQTIPQGWRNKVGRREHLTPQIWAELEPKSVPTKELVLPIALPDFQTFHLQTIPSSHIALTLHLTKRLALAGLAYYARPTYHVPKGFRYNLNLTNLNQNIRALD